MRLAQDQQDIIDAQAALATLGIAPANFTPALQQLLKLRAAQQDITKIQANQFAPDGFNLINQVQSASAQTDKVVVIAQFLRAFMEYGVTQGLALQGTYATVPLIVDHIPPMGGAS